MISLKEAIIYTLGAAGILTPLAIILKCSKSLYIIGSKQDEIIKNSDKLESLSAVKSPTPETQRQIDSLYIRIQLDSALIKSARISISPLHY